MSLKWTDSLDIALELLEKHSDVDPHKLHFTELYEWILALDDFDVRNRLNMEEAQPYSGIVIASGVDNVFAGDKVLISKVCNDNFSSHIKFAGEVLKLIRVGDILGLDRKENLYE